MQETIELYIETRVNDAQKTLATRASDVRDVKSHRAKR